MSGFAQRTAAIVILLWSVAGITLSWQRDPLTSQPMCTVQNRWQVNLNAATLDELQLLPRIGPALAQRIIDDRTLNGPFLSLDDLQRVRGPALRPKLEMCISKTPSIPCAANERRARTLGW